MCPMHAVVEQASHMHCAGSCATTHHNTIVNMEPKQYCKQTSQNQNQISSNEEHQFDHRITITIHHLPSELLMQILERNFSIPTLLSVARLVSHGWQSVVTAICARQRYLRLGHWFDDHCLERRFFGRLKLSRFVQLNLSLNSNSCNVNKSKQFAQWLVETFPNTSHLLVKDVFGPKDCHLVAECLLPAWGPGLETLSLEGYFPESSFPKLVDQLNQLEKLTSFNTNWIWPENEAVFKGLKHFSLNFPAKLNQKLDPLESVPRIGLDVCRSLWLRTGRLRPVSFDRWMFKDDENENSNEISTLTHLGLSFKAKHLEAFIDLITQKFNGLCQLSLHCVDDYGGKITKNQIRKLSQHLSKLTILTLEEFRFDLDLLDETENDELFDSLPAITELQLSDQCGLGPLSGLTDFRLTTFNWRLFLRSLRRVLPCLSRFRYRFNCSDSENKDSTAKIQSIIELPPDFRLKSSIPSSSKAGMILLDFVVVLGN